MTGRQRLLSILIGVFGAIGSAIALVAFLLKIRRNGLELPDFPTSQAVYVTVGEAYTGGFVAGFSLSFFLTLLAVAVGTWLEGRRHAAAFRTDSTRNSLVSRPPRG
jgi:hypothetical protein